MELVSYLDIVIYFGMLSGISWTYGGDIRLECNETRKLESPNYPDNYGHNLNIVWNVTAPAHKGIAITIEEFDTDEGDDILGIVDPERSFSSLEYSGSPKFIPPFLATGSSVLITFLSNEKNSDSGFILELHCYNTSERTSNIKLANSIKINEGILEVLNPDTSNQWLPVCDESWNSKLAELTCRQLGFLGVYQFTSEEDENYKKLTCAKIDCEKSNFLLQQCALNLIQKDLVNASRLYCFTFAYRGCFPLPANFTTNLRSNTTDVSDCMYACSAKSFELAGIRWDGCYCFNVSQSAIHNETPGNEKCTLECDPDQETTCPPGGKNWAFHYNVTIGFCKHPGKVDHGWWSSNNTYLGSGLTLTCDPGYVINGSNTIECRPYDADRKVDWDSKIPHCQYLTPTSPAEEVKDGRRKSLFAIASIIPALIIVGLLLYKGKKIVEENQCQRVYRIFTEKQPTERKERTPSVDHSSLIEESCVKSSNKAAGVQQLVASTSGCPESPLQNRQDEKSSKQGFQEVESHTTPLSTEEDEDATVSDFGQGHEDSSPAGSKDVDKGKTRANAALAVVLTEMSFKHPQQSQSSKSLTMRNRPLPQCPNGGILKPPVPSGKAQTLTRLDQPGDTDKTPSTSKQHIASSNDNNNVSKKAPGGSTPYVKAKSKRNKNTGNSKNRNYHGSMNNSNSAPQADTLPQEQLYSDIDDTHLQDKDEVSASMTGDAFVPEGRFDENLKPPTPVTQHAGNLYHTLENTNTDLSTVVGSEYEDIGSTEGKFNGNGAYDRLNFK